jgi:hypothetical protein
VPTKRIVRPGPSACWGSAPCNPAGANMKEGHTMTDEELIDALGTDLGLSWDMVFCEDKGAAVRDAAREYLAARSAKEEAGKKLIGLAMAV